MGDVSGKVWSTLITTQQAGIYPRTSLGFAIYRISSPAPIYWRFALRVYCPCANILALCVLSFKSVLELWLIINKLKVQVCARKNCYDITSETLSIKSEQPYFFFKFSDASIDPHLHNHYITYPQLVNYVICRVTNTHTVQKLHRW